MFLGTPLFYLMLMSRNILFLLAVFSLCSFTVVHKFYVSVTEIEHNVEAQSLQVISRVFTDDFENVLKARYDSSLRLGHDIETAGAEALIKKYLDQKMKIAVDGKEVSLDYLGKEYDNDMIIFYIEVAGIKNIDQIRVENSVLMDLFEEQKNLIHVQVRGKTKSMVLVSGNERSSLKF